MKKAEVIPWVMHDTPHRVDATEVPNSCAQRQYINKITKS